ncbi:MAG: ATP-binding protein [Flavobacteriaceae bacterium]
MNEAQNIEWKQRWRDEYLKWICAFANTEGGKLFIGKDDDGNTVHLDQYKSLLEDIPSKIKNYMGIICPVILHDDGGNMYIEIKVNSYANPISYRGKYYIRSGSTTHELNGVDLAEFLLLKSGKTWDEILVEDATIKDIDSNSIIKFIADSKEKGRLPDTDGLTDIEILEKLRLAYNGQIKRAGIVLFGKDPNRFFPNCKVMIGRFGIDSEELKFQEPLEGNVVYLLDEVQRMLNYKFLTRPIDFEGMHRREGDEYPVAALREMLLNALVHKKYMGAAIQIRVFDKKLSIWNEGALPNGMTVENLKTEHNSISPNPVLADACFKAGYIDTWGRGTLKIFKACKDAGLPEPHIIEKDGGIEVTLYKVKTTKDVSDSIQFSEKFQNDFGKISEQIRKEFGTKVEATFKFINEHPEYSAEKIADQLGVTSRTIENHQAKLKEGGYIERKGDNVGGYWEILKK